jgi:hypothetical protein
MAAALAGFGGKRKFDRAESLFREVVEGSREKLGLAHPDTQQRIRNLVACYEQMGQAARGEPLVRELALFREQQAGAATK